MRKAVGIVDELINRDVVGCERTLSGQVRAFAANFEQRDQLQVAPGFVGAAAASGVARNVGIGRIVVVLDLRRPVGGPVQHVVGVPQMFGIAGAQLKINKGGLAHCEVVDRQLQRLGLA